MALARKSVGQIARWMDQKASPLFAEDWDNVGLLVGKRSWKAGPVLVAIDLTDDALDQAIRLGSGLMITHHPCVFPGGAGPKKELIQRAISNRVAIFASHTNFDRCALEVVREAARGLGVKVRGRLLENGQQGKSSVNAPVSNHHLVRGLGYGFWGDIPKGQSFSELAENVRILFRVKGLLVTAEKALLSQFEKVTPGRSRAKRIAFVAGKGSSFIQSAASFQCDVFITGETGYHKALDGMRRGMMVMEIGHCESERLFLDTVQDWLEEFGLKVIKFEESNQKIVWEPNDFNRKRRRKE